MTEKNYAQQRASILENLDGLRVDVDAEKRIGYLILDREPLNIVSYTGRQQIRAIIEEMDEDDDVGDPAGLEPDHLALVALVPDLEVCVRSNRGGGSFGERSADLGRESGEIARASGEKAGIHAMRGWERPRPARSRTVEESQR